jgi:hypothetical protein
LLRSLYVYHVTKTKGLVYNMQWVVIAGALALSALFWQQMVAWANNIVANWVGALLGPEMREAFLLMLAGLDRAVVTTNRAVTLLAQRLLRVRLLFQRIGNGQTHQKVVQAEIKQDDGQVMKLEHREEVAWHELPDEVREKFIRRQTSNVEIELKMK